MDARKPAGQGRALLPPTRPGKVTSGSAIVYFPTKALERAWSSSRRPAGQGHAPRERPPCPRSRAARACWTPPARRRSPASSDPSQASGSALAHPPGGNHDSARHDCPRVPFRVCRVSPGLWELVALRHFTLYRVMPYKVDNFLACVGCNRPGRTRWTRKDPPLLIPSSPLSSLRVYDAPPVRLWSRSDSRDAPEGPAPMAPLGGPALLTLSSLRPPGAPRPPGPRR